MPKLPDGNQWPEELRTFKGTEASHYAARRLKELSECAICNTRLLPTDKRSLLVAVTPMTGPNNEIEGASIDSAAAHSRCSVPRLVMNDPEPFPVETDTHYSYSVLQHTPESGRDYLIPILLWSFVGRYVVRTPEGEEVNTTIAGALEQGFALQLDPDFTAIVMSAPSVAGAEVEITDGTAEIRATHPDAGVLTIATGIDLSSGEHDERMFLAAARRLGKVLVIIGNDIVTPGTWGWNLEQRVPDGEVVAGFLKARIH